MINLVNTTGIFLKNPSVNPILLFSNYINLVMPTDAPLPSFVLLQDGSNILLQDGTSKLLLN